MKKLIRKLLSFLLFVIIVLSFLGCSLISPIVGIWEDSTNNNIVEFTRDAKFVFNSHGHLVSGKYELIGDNVVKLNLEGFSGELASFFGVDTWQYTISGNTMEVISGGQTITYKKVKSLIPTASTQISSALASPTGVSPEPSISVINTPRQSTNATIKPKPSNPSTITGYVTKTSPTISPKTETIVSTPVKPMINSISKIGSTQTQAITINGQGFGSLQPYNGTSKYIEITNLTWGWQAGYNNNGVTLNISQWKDNQIQISGFTGKYGDFILHVGDNLRIKVWNAPSGLGPSTYSAVCGALTNAVSATPVITNVSDILATQIQTITISGSGFGTLDPYNGTSPFIQITNKTSGWGAGYNVGTSEGPNGVTLNITQWTDNQIQISGFTGKYGDFILHVGDNLQIKVWSVPSGKGPVSHSIVCLGN